MKKENEEIRFLMVRNGVKYWEVAEQIGISAGTFTVWLRTPLDGEKETRVKKAIRDLVKNKKGEVV